MKKILLVLCLGLLSQTQIALAESSYAAPYNQNMGYKSLYVIYKASNFLIEIVGLKDYGRNSYSAILLHKSGPTLYRDYTSHLGYQISASSDLKSIVKAVCKGRDGNPHTSYIQDASFVRIGSDFQPVEIPSRQGEFLESISCN